MGNAVKLVVFDADGQILVLRRSDTHPTLPLHPDLPGGYVDPGEEPIQAVLRELTEETGLELKPEQINYEVSIGSDHEGHWRIFSSRIETVAPEVTISWEHDHYSWMKVSDFLDLSLPHEPDMFLEFARSYIGRL